MFFKRAVTFLTLMLGTLLIPPPAVAQWGKAIARGTERSLARSSGKSALNVFRRDLFRDRTTRAKKLLSNRSAFRYTSKARARVESRAGIPAGSHLTSRALPGRPLSAGAAQRRFGLPARPAVRERVLLRKGTFVQMNKALGGEPGYGEIRAARRIPPTNIRKVIRLQKQN